MTGWHQQEEILLGHFWQQQDVTMTSVSPVDVPQTALIESTHLATDTTPALVLEPSSFCEPASLCIFSARC